MFEQELNSVIWFGFVELAEGEDLQRAIAGLNGQTLEGRPLTVNEARPRRTGFSRPCDKRGSGGNRRGSFKPRRDYSKPQNTVKPKAPRTCVSCKEAVPRIQTSRDRWRG